MNSSLLFPMSQGCFDVCHAISENFTTFFEVFFAVSDVSRFSDVCLAFLTSLRRRFFLKFARQFLTFFGPIFEE